MKTQNLNNKLAFNKAAVAELNDNSLNEIKGGSTGCVCDAIVDAINEINDAINQVTKPMVY